MNIILHRWQPEKYKQNVEVASTWKNFCVHPWPWYRTFQVKM